MEAIGRAVGVFAVTDVDDLVIIALFVGRLAGVRGRTARVAPGRYLGLLPLVLGLREGSGSGRRSCSRALGL